MGITFREKMESVFKKLNLKHQTEILVLNAPKSFESELLNLASVVIHDNAETMDAIDFVLVFVLTRDTVDTAVSELVSKIKSDVTLWFAYPKGTSKKYQSDISRDIGWDALGEIGFEGVRLVAIDEDWSALRFRRVEFIKSIAREPKRALSLKSRARALNK